MADLEQIGKTITTTVSNLLSARKEQVIKLVQNGSLPERVVPKTIETPIFDGNRSKWDYEKQEWKQLFKVVLCYKEGTAKNPILYTTCKACQYRDGRYCTSKEHILYLHVKRALDRERLRMTKAFNRTFGKR
jgi:hypothetical protein